MENENVTLQTACSLGIRNRNYDGSISVHCKICKRFVCNTDGKNNFFSCICVLCQKAEEGILLSKEVEDQIKRVRMSGGNDLPYAIINPEPVNDPMVGDKQVVGRVNYWFKTLSAAVVAPIKKKILTSKELAKEKKHKPLLAGGLEINIHKNE